MTFQLLTQSMWTRVYADLSKSSFPYSQYVATAFCLTWIFISSYLIKIFVAVILEGFVANESDPKFIRTIEGIDREERRGRGFGAQLMWRLTTYNFEDDNLSLLLLSRKNPFRRVCMRLVNSWHYEIGMEVMVVLSCAKLVFDTYLGPASPPALLKLSYALSIVFTICFLVECLAKIVAKGLLFPSDSAYLRDNFGRLDFIIVAFSIFEIVSYPDYSYMKALRCLRLVRLVAKKKNVKDIVQALGNAFWSLVNILGMTLMVYLIFAILLMSLLEQHLQYCKADDYGGLSEFELRRGDCTGELLPGAAWGTRFFHFDNIGRSLLSLFVLNSQVNWPQQFLSWVDSGPEGPVRDRTPGYLPLLMAILLICNYLTRGMIVGCLYLNFHSVYYKAENAHLSV